MRALSMLLLGACGRVGFDAVAVSDGSSGGGSDGAPVDITLLGHDEDGNGIDDGPDGCPHIADPGQADQDGDRVGDACDPEPTVPRQTRGVFLSMTPGSEGDNTDLEWIELADSWQSSATASADFEVLAPSSNADVWVALRVMSLGTAPRHVLVGVNDDATPDQYQAELWDDGTTNARATIVYYDGVSSNFFGGNSSRSYGSDMPLDLLTVHVRVRTAGPQWEADMDFPGNATHIELTTADLASFAGGDRVDVYASSVQLEVNYVFVVTTTP